MQSTAAIALMPLLFFLLRTSQQCCEYRSSDSQCCSMGRKMP